MALDPVLLARIQFALTVGFHFIFPPISIGLAWLLFTLESCAWWKKDEVAKKAALFFAKLLALTFAVGVATGITMEFQFGTNWAEYAKFVGDIFGAPLAAEAVLAFFLESTFLGLYLFGRNKISPAAHWFASLMVAFGATLSAFWILVANSWQQTPTGFVVQNGRAELTDFMAAVLNPSMMPRFLHTFDAAIITGAFFMAGISAYLLLKNNAHEMARKTLRLALIVGFIASCLELFPFGHLHAKQVADTQPEKLATFEGLFDGQTKAPFVLFGIPTEKGMVAKIGVPGVLSLFVGNSLDTYVKGRNDFPRADLPNPIIPFVSFHAMVGVGMLFIAAMAWGLFQLYRGKLYTDKWYLMGLIALIPLPVLGCQFGWIAAEVGRQPWIVYHLLRTRDAISLSVPAQEVVISIILFTSVYALLFLMYVLLTVKIVKREVQEEGTR